MTKVWIKDSVLQCASQVCEVVSCPRFNDCEEIKGFELVMTKMRLDKENRQLREVLKKCNPYSNYTLTAHTHCFYCKAFHMDEHKDDCEYIKLTKESEHIYEKIHGIRYRD